MDLLDRLLGHDQWTTERYFDLAATLTDAQLDQPFDIGHRTLRATFAHMIEATLLWATLMAQTAPPGRIPPLSDRSLPALREQYARAYPAFAAQARAAVAAGRLDETFIDHYQYPQSYGTTILQVAMHNQQHRSELRHIFERLGVTDLADGDPQEWEHHTKRERD